MNKLFAVIGNPVLHSASPEMHNAAFRRAGFEGLYFRLAVSGPAEALQIAKEIGISGINITSPFKEAMAQAVPEKDSLVEKLDAANTVLLGSGSRRAFNTDGYGVTEALKANGVEVSGKKIVVLGGSGAARAAGSALSEAGSEVIVANRTIGKAASIAASCGAEFCGISESELEQALVNAAALVSCLSTTAGVVPAGLLPPSLAVLEANYSKPSALYLAAQERGCKLVHGREWLLYQGVAAYRHFTGTSPSVEAMRRALLSREAVSSKPGVALIGMMGSGKSVVAEHLGRLLALEVKELDSDIEKQAQEDIPQIFKNRGEAGFREIESGLLEKAACRPGVVLSCGGGIVLAEENRRLLSENFITVWLWVAPAIAAERVARDSSRPLLQGVDRAHKIRELLDVRLPLYASCADLVIGTEGQSPAALAERICSEINKTRQN